MYCGLLSFSYLLIFGISVVILNHPFKFTQTPSGVETWTQPLALPPLARSDSDSEKFLMVRQNNAVVLRAVGSFAMPTTPADGGWTDPDTYHAHFVRPGKEYQIDVHPSQNSATIKQSRMGFLRMSAELHFNGYSMFSTFWKWYVELCTIAVIAAGIAGIYLWPTGASDRRIGIIVLGLFGAFSIAVMLFLSLHG
jgi:hypothetical protein